MGTRARASDRKRRVRERLGIRMRPSYAPLAWIRTFSRHTFVGPLARAQTAKEWVANGIVTKFHSSLDNRRLQ